MELFLYAFYLLEGKAKETAHSRFFLLERKRKREREREEEKRKTTIRFVMHSLQWAISRRRPKRRALKQRA
jgi:hypothetical protein